jgi:hypothetical protein
MNGISSSKSSGIWDGNMGTIDSEIDGGASGTVDPDFEEATSPISSQCRKSRMITRSGSLLGSSA